MDPAETNSPAEESKADKFKRLATGRVNNALAKIELIGNLASSHYDFTFEQYERILISLKEAVENLDKKFQKTLNKKGFNDEGKFHL